MLKKPQKCPISDFFDLTPKYFLVFLYYTDLVPPSNDPVPPSTNQYRPILIQYYQVQPSTAPYWPSTIIYQPVPLHTDPVPPSISQCQLILLLLGITDFCTVYPGSCTYTAHHKFSGALNLGLSDSHPSLDTKRHPLLSWPFQDIPLLQEKVFGCNEIICNDMHMHTSSPLDTIYEDINMNI